MGRRKRDEIKMLDPEAVELRKRRLIMDLDRAIHALYGVFDVASRRIVVHGRDPRLDTLLAIAGKYGFELNASRRDQKGDGLAEAWRIDSRDMAERLMLRMNENACRTFKRCSGRTLEANGITASARRSYTDNNKSLPLLSRFVIYAELLNYHLTWYDPMNGRRIDREYYVWAESCARAARTAGQRSATLRGKQKG